jgi:hypothetical protein
VSETFALLSAASALLRRPPRTLAGGTAPAVWRRGVARAASRLRTLERLSAWPLAFDAAAEPALRAGSPFDGYLAELVARSQPATQDGGEAARLPRRDSDSRTANNAPARSRSEAARRNDPRDGSRHAEDSAGTDAPGTSVRAGVRGAASRRKARVPLPAFRLARTEAATGVETLEARPSTPLLTRAGRAARRADLPDATNGLAAHASGDASPLSPLTTRSTDVAGRDTGRNVEGPRVAIQHPDAAQDEPATAPRDSLVSAAWAGHGARRSPAEAHQASSLVAPDAAPLNTGERHSSARPAPDEERLASTPFDDDGARATSRTACEVLGLPPEAEPSLLLRLGGAATPSQRGTVSEPAAQTHETRTSATSESATQTLRAGSPQVDGRRSRQIERRQLPSFTSAEAQARSNVRAEPSHRLRRAGADVPLRDSGRHDAPPGVSWAATVGAVENASPPALRAESFPTAGAHAVSFKSTGALDVPQASRGTVRHAWLGGLVRRVERVLRRGGGLAGSGVAPASSESGFVPSGAAAIPLYRDWSWSLEGQSAPPRLLISLAGTARPEPDAGRSGHARGSSSRTTPHDDRPRTHAASSDAASRGNFEPPPARNEHRQTVLPYAEDGARLLPDGEWTDFSLPQRIAPPALAPSLPTLIPPRALDVPVLPVASETARLGARVEADAGEYDMEVLAAKIKFILDEQARRHGIDV